MMASGTSSKSRSKKLEKVSPSVFRKITPKLEQSLVVAKDLKDQPVSRYVLLTGTGRPVYYAVDAWDVMAGGEVMIFYQGDKAVYVCRREGAWALVARETVNVVTDAEMAEHQVKETKEVEEFYAKLDPAGWEEAQKLAAAGGLEAILGGGGGARQHAHPSVDDGKPVPGQYL